MKLDKKRRIKSKTDYRKRLRLLKSNAFRLAVRKTNKYLILQIIESKNSQDRVIYSVNTKELLKYGWPEEKSGSLKSVPASYLAGYLLGKKAKSIKGGLVLDTGLIPNTKGSRVYAAVKGAVDSGLGLKCNEKVFPSEERINGKHNNLNEIFNKILEKLKENGKKL